MDPETVELGATLGALESLLGGCTTQLDMYFHHEATHRGAVAAGSRHVIGPVFFDGPGPDGLAWPERLANLRAWPAVLDEIGGPARPRGRDAARHLHLLPRGPHRGRRPTLRKVLADTGRPGLLTTHVSENRRRERRHPRALRRHPHRAARAHRLARARPAPRRSATACTSPRATATLRRGRPAPRSATAPGRTSSSPAVPCTGKTVRDSGIRLGLGTDGCSSSNDLDMWQAMRQAALLARLTSGRPDVASATEVLRAATIEGARALGLGDRDRLGRGRQAGRPRARRPRGAPPHPGARRRRAARLRGRPR